MKRPIRQNFTTTATTVSIILSIILLLPLVTFAQLPRERAVIDEQIDNIFWASKNVGISTVRNPSAKNLNTTVLHTFGLVRGGVDHFFGMDDGANTRIGIEYGITDRWSVAAGRMTFNNVVDLSSKINLFRQTRSEGMPVDIAVKLATGINTTSGTGLRFSERSSYLTSLMIARKFGSFSAQLTPMLAHFGHVQQGIQEQLVGLGILANYELNDRFALSAEYLPVLGDRNPGTEDAIAFSMNINTGGHIFQIFFASSQWHNEQFIMANNHDKFLDGDFRFGFNIHRVFGLSRN